MFDIYTEGQYWSRREMEFVGSQFFDVVPTVYVGPFSKERLDELTTGETTLGDNHIREGLVVRPWDNERTFVGGHIEQRLILKSINEDYLLRKSGTEYN